MEGKVLTYEDLDKLYKTKTGKSAKILSLDTVYQWAIRQPEIIVNRDSTLKLSSK